MENYQIQLLAKRLNLTDLEPEKEEYILTSDEADVVIKNAVKAKKEHTVWRMKDKGLSEQEILKRISEINFENEIDIQELLNQANSSKQYDLWQKQQREKEKQEYIQKQKELQELWTAEKVFGLMKWTSENVYGKKLVVHNDNKSLIRALCFFISSDQRFETELGYSLKKGLLIRGVSGLGKTYLVKCILENGRLPILIESMLEISEIIKNEGEYQINLGKNKILYLDDVGTEQPTINHYGTKINFFKNFIEVYYLQNKPFNRLIISTNNSFSEIEEKYGFRVRSRIKDIFNIVDVSGKDMRG